MSTGTRPSPLLRTPAGTQHPAPAHPATAWSPLIRHYLEMVVAMAVGMVVLHPLWVFGLDALGLPGALDHAAVMAMAMATDMSLGMGAWMRFRGHSWRPVVEMSATMYLPFVVFLPPVWAGAMSGGAMITAGHLLMLPSMFGLMLWRRDGYGHGHHDPSHPEPATGKQVVVAADEALADLERTSPDLTFTSCAASGDEVLCGSQLALKCSSGGTHGIDQRRVQQ